MPEPYDLFDYLDKKFIFETEINSDGTIEIEIYNDDITKFTVIPYSTIKEIQKYYIIISLSPKLKDIDGETFGSLGFLLKDKDSLI